MKKTILFLLFLLILPLSFANLVGPSYSLTDINSFKVTLKNNNVCSIYPLSESDFAKLKTNSGIFAADLSVKFTPNIESNSYLQFFVNDMPVKFKTKVGYKYSESIGYSNFQDGRYILLLEDFKDQNELNLKICGFVSGSVYDLELLPGSKVGSFKLPYFGCSGCFEKTLDNYLFLVGDMVKAEISLKNMGTDSATVFIKYNYFDVNTEIKMLGGEVFYTGLSGLTDSTNIFYYFKSKTDKYFLIPPASVEYVYDGYKFTELSNPIIVNAKNYLDDVECEVNPSKIEYSTSETAKLILTCYNKSSELKQFNLVLNINDAEMLNDDILIESKKVIEKVVPYTYDNLDKKSACGAITTGMESKNIPCVEFYFSEGTSNYTWYILGFIILVLFGIFIYYQFFL